MALFDSRDPRQFDIGGSLLKNSPGGLFYDNGQGMTQVPIGMRPVQTDTGGGYFSPEQIQLMALTGIGGAAGAGAGAAGAGLTGGQVFSGINTAGRLAGGNSMPTQSQYNGFEPWLGGGTNGGTTPPGLFDNLLGTVGNLSPAILAGYLGNSQRQDVMGQVGRLNDVAGSLSGPAFMQSITNPYDLQTGQGRTALSQSLQQRGVGGSSFGNQQLGNYDYQRGLGRGDLATRAAAGVAGTQGQLYSNALHGMVGANSAYNSLLGAGLGASGSLFNRPGGTGVGLGGSLSGLGDSIANLFGGGIPTLPGAPPNQIGGLYNSGVDQYGNPIGGNFQGGTGGQDGTGFNDFTGGYGGAPALGSVSSGNGLFDWLGQNGGDYGGFF
jgi:hypothetical protein